MPQVIESYKDYTPPIDAKAVVEKLLNHVPAKYLAGLGSVVLTNQTQLSHRRRRGKTWSRGRKYRHADALGLYHQAWKGDPA